MDGCEKNDGEEKKKEEGESERRGERKKTVKIGKEDERHIFLLTRLRLLRLLRFFLLVKTKIVIGVKAGRRNSDEHERYSNA